MRIMLAAVSIGIIVAPHILGSISPGAALSEEPAKSSYSFVRPVPDALLRELSPDRPDKTESPITVDAGHFQIELDFAAFTRDHDNDGARSSDWAILPSNFKVGIDNNIDLQLIVGPFEHAREGTTSSRQGFGDITTRIKYNVWGNDGGPTALGVMPFVKIPTNQNNLGNDDVEGGLIVPFALALTDVTNLGLMEQLNVNRADSDDSYFPEFVTSATISRLLWGDLGGYAELFTAKGTESETAWKVTSDFGLGYSVNKNFQLDCGINIGLTREAEDWTLFAGMTKRI